MIAMTIFILNSDSLESLIEAINLITSKICTQIALIIEINYISTMGTKFGTSIECLAAPPSQRSMTPVYAGLFRVASFTLALLLVGHGISVWGSTQYETTSRCRPRFRHILHSIVRSPSIWFTLFRYYIIVTLYLYSRLDNTSAHFAHSQLQ